MRYSRPELFEILLLQQLPGGATAHDYEYHDYNTGSAIFDPERLASGAPWRSSHTSQRVIAKPKLKKVHDFDPELVHIVIADPEFYGNVEHRQTWTMEFYLDLYVTACKLNVQMCVWDANKKKINLLKEFRVKEFKNFSTPFCDENITLIKRCNQGKTLIIDHYTAFRLKDVLDQLDVIVKKSTTFKQTDIVKLIEQLLLQPPTTPYTRKIQANQCHTDLKVVTKEKLKTLVIFFNDDKLSIDSRVTTTMDTLKRIAETYRAAPKPENIVIDVTNLKTGADSAFSLGDLSQFDWICSLTIQYDHIDDEVKQLSLTLPSHLKTFEVKNAYLQLKDFASDFAFNQLQTLALANAQGVPIPITAATIESLTLNNYKDELPIFDLRQFHQLKTLKIKNSSCGEILLPASLIHLDLDTLSIKKLDLFLALNLRSLRLIENIMLDEMSLQDNVNPFEFKNSLVYLEELVLENIDEINLTNLALLPQLKKLHITSLVTLSDLLDLTKLIHLQEVLLFCRHEQTWIKLPTQLLHFISIRVLPKNLAELTQLKTLSVYGTDFSFNLADLYACKQLEKLCLGNWSGDSIDFLQLPQLRNLELENYNSSEIKFAPSSRLQTLVINSCKYVTRLDLEGNVPELRLLALNHNPELKRVSMIPLPHLREIHIQDCPQAELSTYCIYINAELDHSCLAILDSSSDSLRSLTIYGPDDLSPSDRRSLLTRLHYLPSYTNLAELTLKGLPKLKLNYPPPSLKYFTCNNQRYPTDIEALFPSSLPTSKPSVSAPIVGAKQNCPTFY